MPSEIVQYIQNWGAAKKKFESTHKLMPRFSSLAWFGLILLQEKTC